MLENIKHNKLKNTGIIYQILVMNMIQQALSDKKNTAYRIFKNYFNKDRALAKELALYNMIIQLKQSKKQKEAQYIVQQIIKSRMRIDDVKLQNQKYHCIRQIKQNYDLKRFFDARVNNYKLYGSIYKIFQSLKKNNTNPMVIAQSKITIVQHILCQQKHTQTIQDEDLLLFKQQDKKIKNQILQTYVSKFNQRYANFNDRQRYLLKLYAYSVSNSEVLDGYINQQIDKFKDMKVQQNQQQLKEVIQRLDQVKDVKKVQDKVYALLNLYQLVNQE